MITPSQIPNPYVKPRWQAPVGVMESVVAYNCRKYGMPRPILAVPLWERAGNQAIDLSGHRNHGVLMNGPTWVADGIDCDGVDNYGELTDIDGGSGLPEVTVVSSIRLTSKSSYDGIIDKSDSYNTNVNPVFRLFLDTTSGAQKWRWKVWGSDGATAGNVDSDDEAASGEWVQVVGRYDGAEVAMWIDGVKQAITKVETGSLSSKTNNMRIGVANDNYTNGSFAYCLVYDIGLSVAQIKFLYSNPYFMYRLPEELYGYTTGAPPAVSIPVLLHLYNQMRQ